MTYPHIPWTTTQLAKVRALVATGLTAREIAPQINRSRKSIIKAVVTHDLGPWIAKPGTKPGDINHIPEDFAERWETTPQADLAAHYRRAISTISMWCKRLDLHRPQGRNMRVAAPKPRPKPKLVPNRYQTAPVDRPRIDTSTAGRAADYLRRFGPVVRCNEAGRYDPNGAFWRRGSTLLSHVDVVQRAEYLGWRADAWAMVA